MASFKKAGVLSNSRIFNRKISIKPSGISTPVSFSENTKNTFTLNISPAKQVKDNFRNLVLTNKGERLGRYDYGSDLRRFVTELSSIEDFESTVMESIAIASKKYMPMIDLESFNSSFFDDDESELRRVVITIVYNIPIMSLNNQRLDITLYIV